MVDYSLIVAKNIIELRKSRGLTQQDFAKILNYSDKTISKWELGYAIPNVETLKQIADYFDVTVDYFLSEHETIDESDKKKKYFSVGTRRNLLLISVDLFFISICAIVYAALLDKHAGNFWQVFIWGISASLFFNAIMANKWWKYTYIPHIFASFTIWTVLIGIYITLLYFNVDYNFWYLFFIGLPIQFATLIILTLTHSGERK